MRPTCLYCGKPIAKKTRTIRFKKPVAYRAATTKMIAGREMSDLPEREEKLEGHRETLYTTTTIYTANWPRSKAECQRFVNGEVLSVRRDTQDRDFIDEFSYWDGESYVDEFFHNGECARKFAYVAARSGMRLKKS